ncbi:methanogenic corrinoid protein MtbC1 [Sporomusaceae bacterium BoRhaA]|uniref:cobalamin B12-binding domain-containing protein n=1 Tax=Pelorhabdus rhamnosifermentans TaxID=2772457 RepID=UPI001C061F48|nr:cobalamin-dependent protein [Pelorhabdus rhamnosifermentans]MBU2703099.1 methanogenic corrinoid protein MtbC1 [Pelorhabdus rhamnosifermentans]
MSKIDIAKAVNDLDEDLVIDGVKAQITEGVPAIEILAQLQEGMEGVGKLYEAGDYYLSELIMSAEVFSNAANLLGSALADSGNDKKIGTVILGTVKDDIHDIGKNIVSTILSCNGFKVVDVGVDVPIETFLAEIEKSKPQVVGLFCLLTTAFDAMKDTVAAIKASGASATVLVGGGPVDESVARWCAADGYCKNAYDAVEMSKKAV